MAARFTAPPSPQAVGAKKFLMVVVLSIYIIIILLLTVVLSMSAVEDGEAVECSLVLCIYYIGWNLYITSSVCSCCMNISM